MIDSKDISVVVQGAVDKNLTPICLKSIRKILPDATIILSTWEGTDVAGLVYDSVLLNKDPGGFKDKLCGNFTNNLLRQLVSTQNALEIVKTEYVLKIRTDIKLKSNKFLKYKYEFVKFDSEDKIYSEKILSSSFFFKRFLCDAAGKKIMPAPFHISDWFHFGLTDDIKKLYMVDLPTEPEQSDYFYNNKYIGIKPNLLGCAHQYTPEQYIAFNSYKKHSKNPVKFDNYMDYNNQNIVASEKFLVNNFVIMSPKELGFECLKECTNSDFYRKWCKNELSIPYLLWNTLYRPYVFRILYKKHCDSEYKIPTGIYLKEKLQRAIIARGRKCIIL